MLAALKIIMLKLILAFLISCIANVANAGSDTGWISLGYFKEDGEEHSGMEISAFMHTGNNLAARVSGVAFFDKEKTKERETYWGFSFSGYVHPYSKIINPYLGAGFYIGET